MDLFILKYLLIFSYKDFISLFVIISTVYLFFKFLANHNTLNLLAYCMSYYFVFLSSYVLDIKSLFIFLVYVSPVYLVILLLMHQKNLQKNWLGIGTAKKENDGSDIIENISRNLIFAKNKGLFPIVIIERDDITNTLYSRYTEVNAKYTDNLFQSLSKDNIIVFKNNNIKYFDAEIEKIDQIDFYEYLKHICSLLDCIIIYSSKNDYKINILADGNISKVESQSCSYVLKKIINKQKVITNEISNKPKNEIFTT